MVKSIKMYDIGYNCLFEMIGPNKYKCVQFLLLRGGEMTRSKIKSMGSICIQLIIFAQISVSVM